MKMFKKWWHVVVIFLLVVVIAVLVLLGVRSIMKYRATIADQQQSIDELESFINDDVGPMLDCYVVNEKVRAGQEITADQLECITVPEKLVYIQTGVEVEVPILDEEGNDTGETTTEIEVQSVIDATVDIDSVIGKYYRVDMEQGSVLLNQYVVDEPLSDSARYYEAYFEYIPTDIAVGDYVDLRIQFGYGEDYIAIPHKKVMGIDLQNGLVKFIFTEENINTYNSMLLDKAMFSNTSIYMLKYVDAGGQLSSESFYPVNTNIAEIIMSNPNIIDMVNEEMKLERAKINSAQGNLGENTFTEADERRLSEINMTMRDIQRDNLNSRNEAIRERIRAEEEAAREAARNNY